MYYYVLTFSYSVLNSKIIILYNLYGVQSSG